MKLESVSLSYLHAWKAMSSVPCSIINHSASLSPSPLGLMWEISTWIFRKVNLILFRLLRQADFSGVQWSRSSSESTGFSSDPRACTWQSNWHVSTSGVLEVSIFSCRLHDSTNVRSFKKPIQLTLQSYSEPCAVSKPWLKPYASFLYTWWTTQIRQVFQGDTFLPL